MRKITHVWVTILVLAFHYSAHASPAAGSQRNLFQFNNMISYKGYSAFDYNGYGCWCGAGSYGSLVADATDSCCRTHDQCYERINGGIFGCSPKIVTYLWEKRPNKAIECTDPIDTCDRKACECDKAVVDCYERHRFTYYSALLNMGNTEEKTEMCNP